MTPSLTPSRAVGANIDAYGGRARACALADYLEVAALAGKRITRDDLTDIASQLNWSRKSRRQVLVAGDDPEADPDTWAEQAFSMADERADILVNRYPFVEVRGGLEYGGDDPQHEPYVSLLAVSVAHGWQLPCAVKPEPLMETLVASALATMNLRVVQMGTAERSGVGFVDNLVACGQAVGLTPTHEPRPVPASAKDAGVDTLAVLGWSDGRPGRWVMIGQVTCGESLTWQAKLDRPKPAVWKAYLQEALQPQAFLAIPQHIDGRHLAELLSSERGLVLDRLRLTLMKASNSQDEQALIVEVLAAVVE